MSNSFKLILRSRHAEVGNAHSFIFETGQPLTWQAGQFLHLRLPHEQPDSRDSERWFTIAAAPHEGHVQITTRWYGSEASSFKKALFALDLGATIVADGPEGDFVVDDSSDKQFVFIAGGIGITPFRSILLDLARRQQAMDIHLLYGGQDNDFVFRSELDELAAQHADLNIRYVVEPDRIDGDMIRGTGVDPKSGYYYVSGPEPMVEAFETTLGDLGVPESHQRRDYFPGYQWPGAASH